MKWSMFLLWRRPCAALAGTAQAQDKPAAETPEKLPSIADKTKGMQKIDGYMPLYWQAATGKLFMEIGRFNQELLYQVSLPAGLGSNPVGLDRGQLGDSQRRPLRAHRPEGADDRSRTTATAPSPATRRSGARSRIRSRRSVLWGFKVEAEEGGRVLVDATAFFLRDAHGVVERLRQSEAGAATSSTTAAARSTCRAPRAFRRTPRSRRR